jgi:hypothetical protein
MAPRSNSAQARAVAKGKRRQCEYTPSTTAHA